MMRATKALLGQRRSSGAPVRFLRHVDYVGNRPRNQCFANALQVCDDVVAPQGPTIALVHGWLLLRAPRQTAVIQHAWNVAVATGRHFDVTELAEGGNSGAQYVEDLALRMALNGTFELTPVLAGRSFLYRDDTFYEVAANSVPGADAVVDERPWTDFSTAALLRR